MKEGTRKFLVSALVLLMAFSVVVAPFLAIEKVNAQETGSWTTLAPLPTPISSYRDIVALTGKIYYIGSNMTLCYDRKTNNWTQLTPPPNPIGRVFAVCQNKIYVLGGSSEVPTHVYDPATYTWENRTSTHETTGILHANVVNGKIYVMGGDYMRGLGTYFSVSSNYVYDPQTDNWTKLADIPVGVGGYASAVLDKKIYIISGGHGYTYQWGWNPINLVQIFDPTTNQWTNGTSIPTAVNNAKACVITEPSGAKRIHVIGGELEYFWYDQGYGGIDLHQVYDSETDTWINATAMPTPRKGMGLAVIYNEIYAIGGAYNGTFILANEKYSPSDPSGYIPEFPSWLILPLLIAATLTAIIYKKRLTKNRQSSVHIRSLITEYC
jgi:N-acetylneuraminic acid mutarotase